MKTLDRKRQRRLEVLRQLVDSYIQSCTPVPSEQICRYLKSPVSSATVRNTLAELDGLEWTIQPHSCAGRIPSWKGYRAYVDILKASDLSKKDYTRGIAEGLEEFEMSSVDIGPGLQRMAGLLSELSGCAGVVLSPRFENDFIRQIRLLPVDESRVLVVLVSDFGLIRTEIVQIHRKLGYFSQRRVEDYLNARLHGRSGSNEQSVEFYDGEEREFGDEIYNEIVLKYLISLRPHSANEFFLEGLSRVFDNPEFRLPGAVHSVIEFFEDRDGIVATLQQALRDNRVAVSVGEEIRAGNGDVSFSMITAPYKLNSVNVGVLGIIGPMRMPYRRLIPFVDQAADFMSQRLAANFRKPRLAFDRDIPFKITR
jgi:heat-inducible transcriptional repressor